MYSKHYRKERLSGWGGFPSVLGNVFRPERECDLVEFLSRNQGPFLARGGATTYGDASINTTGVNIDMRRMNKMLDFCPDTGILHCQAGVSLGDIIKTFLPKGWFLHVTPGTQFATVGGCVACDAHGKNWQAGSFGNFVKGLRLMLHDGRTVYCDEKENTDLFFGTLGAMGMTGIIIDVLFQLKPVSSSYVDVETIRFNNLEQLFELQEESMGSHEYLFSWVDSLKEGQFMGRGVFQRANHNNDSELHFHAQKRVSVPCNLPRSTVNRFSVASFNALYLATSPRHRNDKRYLIDFFYPLDRIANWRRIYGRNGFVEYQAVAPVERAYETVSKLMKHVTNSKLGAHVAAVKPLSTSKGLLSFPMNGATLAVDFKVSDKLWPLLDHLDQIVIESGGKVYLGKDARLSGANFRAMYHDSLESLEVLRKKYQLGTHINSLMHDRLSR